MTITLELAAADSLIDIIETASTWQRDGVPVWLHPRDLGWNWSLGEQELAAAVRLWRRDGQTLAMGMVDDDTGMIRMVIAPSVDEDNASALQLLADLSDPGRGVLRPAPGPSRPDSVLPFDSSYAGAVGLPMRTGPRCVVT